MKILIEMSSRVCLDITYLLKTENLFAENTVAKSMAVFSILGGLWTVPMGPTKKTQNAENSIRKRTPNIA